MEESRGHGEEISYRKFARGARANERCTNDPRQILFVFNHIICGDDTHKKALPNGKALYG